MKVIKPKIKTEKAKKQAQKKLPPDTYEPLIEKSEIVVDENRKFVISVQRGGEDGLPCVDVRTFQTTEAYTGFTKKGINFPLEMLPDLQRVFEEVADTCDKEGLFKEFESE